MVLLGGHGLGLMMHILALRMLWGNKRARRVLTMHRVRRRTRGNFFFFLGLMDMTDFMSIGDCSTSIFFLCSG